jgi:hypothetical protein
MLIFIQTLKHLISNIKIHGYQNVIMIKRGLSFIWSKKNIPLVVMSTNIYTFDEANENDKQLVEQLYEMAKQSNKIDKIVHL